MKSKAGKAVTIDAENPETVPPLNTPPPPQIPIDELVSKVFGGLSADASEDQKNVCKATVGKYIQNIIDANPISNKFNIVIIFDELRMVESDTDSIYSALTQFSSAKPILLILHSSGGHVGPAYLIGKLLQEHSGCNLDVVVPRRAKSAATILCCAAERIHLGSMSELGPIDPQFDGLPALGLKSAIEHIAALAKEYPHAIELLSRYMSATIQPIHLGHYERVAESAVQYADRLMTPHSKYLPSSPEQIARRLVYSYKDHGFVIDKQEAIEIFGSKVVHHNTPEYNLGNEIYQALGIIKSMANFNDYNLSFNGSTTTGPNFFKRKARI